MSTTDSKTSLIDRLFAAGAHFGFQKRRRHPSVIPYLYGNKEGTDIFDLQKTAALLEVATNALKEAGKTGKTVLFVSTKEETSKLLKQAAEEADMPYVSNRWIGGMLTNFTEVKKRIARLHTLVSEGEKGELERKYTKRERVMISREVEKLNFNFGGIKDMERLPGLMLIVDPRHDAIALKEANQLNIPVVAILSSDTDANKITYPVFANDSLQASVALLLKELTAALAAGRAEMPARSHATTERGGRGAGSR